MITLVKFPAPVPSDDNINIFISGDEEWVNFATEEILKSSMASEEYNINIFQTQRKTNQLKPC